MRIRPAFIAVLLIALCAVAYPWLEVALYAVRLAGMPAPTSLAMPIPKLKRRQLSDTWQAPRAPRRRHEGIDIFASRGTPVFSTTQGIVFARGTNSLGGNVVWVLGPSGQRHYYAHLSHFAQIGLGEPVHAGTLLGYVGNRAMRAPRRPICITGCMRRRGRSIPIRCWRCIARLRERCRTRGLRFNGTVMESFA